MINGGGAATGSTTSIAVKASRSENTQRGEVTRRSKVRFWEQTGKHLLSLSFTGFVRMSHRPGTIGSVLATDL
jgi:hypothetical protein